MLFLGHQLSGMGVAVGRQEALRGVVPRFLVWRVLDRVETHGRGSAATLLRETIHLQEVITA
jgi:hypothetical protein